MGTNASYFIPNEVSKHHDVMVVEGPSYDSESDLIVVEPNKLNIQSVNETELEKRFLELCKYIDEFKPDVVHVFYHYQALELGHSLRRKYGTKIKLLLDIRTPLLEENWFLRVRVQLKNMRLQKAFDMITTHSLYSVGTIFPFSFLPAREVSYGVDTSAFKVRFEPWGNKNINLVYTGAISKKRNVDQLIRSFSALLKTDEAKQNKFFLNLYGSGNRLAEVMDITKQLKIDDSVIFHGVINQSKLSKVLHTNSIGIGYVPFGIYKQAPALKTIEYMCAGLNVLASNTRSTRDLLTKGFYLTTYDNTDAGFVEGVLSIVQQGWNKQQAQTNIKLMEDFDWGNIVLNSLLPVYEELSRD